MRWGCCGSMISPANDALGIAMVEQIARLGFDYIELSLAALWRNCPRRPLPASCGTRRGGRD